MCIYILNESYLHYGPKSFYYYEFSRERWLYLIKIIYFYRIYKVGKIYCHFFVCRNTHKISFWKEMLFPNAFINLSNQNAVYNLVKFYLLITENVPRIFFLGPHSWLGCFICIWNMWTCSVFELLTMYWNYIFSWLSHSPSYKLPEESSLALLTTECLTQVYVQYLLNKHYFKILK